MASHMEAERSVENIGRDGEMENGGSNRMNCWAEMGARSHSPDVDGTLQSELRDRNIGVGGSLLDSTGAWVDTKVGSGGLVLFETNSYVWAG